MSIKLPKPFGEMLKKYQRVFMNNGEYEVTEAYFDNGYSLVNGIGSLRQLLGLSGNDTCADGYIILKHKEGEKEEKIGILWEDKGSQGKGTHFSDGVKQLKSTHIILKQKMALPLRFHVVLSNIKLGKGFIEAKYVDEHQCRILKKPNNGEAILCGEYPIKVLDN